MNFHIASINDFSGCDEPDCTFAHTATSSTLLSWGPTYDKNGNVLNYNDPNTYFHEYKCVKCGEYFSVDVKYGEVIRTRRVKYS